MLTVLKYKTDLTSFIKVVKIRHWIKIGADHTYINIKDPKIALRRMWKLLTRIVFVCYYKPRLVSRIYFTANIH